MQLTGIELVTASGPCETQAEARVIGRAIIADVHGKGAPIWPTINEIQQQLTRKIGDGVASGEPLPMPRPAGLKVDDLMAPRAFGE